MKYYATGDKKYTLLIDIPSSRTLDATTTKPYTGVPTCEEKDYKSLISKSVLKTNYCTGPGHSSTQYFLCRRKSGSFPALSTPAVHSRSAGFYLAGKLYSLGIDAIIGLHCPCISQRSLLKIALLLQLFSPRRTHHSLHCRTKVQLLEGL